MEEQWLVQRIRTSKITGTRKGRFKKRGESNEFEYPIEEYVIGKGKTLTDAVNNFEYNDRRKYEERPRPHSSRGYARWG